MSGAARLHHATHGPAGPDPLGLADLPVEVANGGQAIAWMPPPSGDATGATDTAALNAINAANTKVQFGTGTYYFNAQILYYPGGRWSGSQQGGTALKLVADLYVSGSGPAHWLVPSGTTPFNFNQFQPFLIEHMWLKGPGVYSLAQTPCKTTAVMMNQRCQMDRCSVSGFFAGAEMFNDHQVITHSKLGNNYYGIDFPDSMPGFSNQHFSVLDLTGNCLASIHIGGGGICDGVVAEALHLGACPVGVFKTDNQDGWDGAGNPTYGGTPSTRSGIIGCEFTGVYFEGIGNCCILDISTGGASSTIGGGTKWRSTGHAWSNTYLTTTAPLNNAAYQQAWAVVGRTILADVEFDCGEYPFLAGSVGVWKVTTGGPTVRLPTTPVATFVGSGATWSYGFAGIRVKMPQGEGITMIAGGTISVGDIVEMVASTSFNDRVQRATNTKPIFGVALTPGTAGGSVVIQTQGLVLVNCIGTGQIPAGSVLTLSTTTTYLADLVAAGVGNVPVGVSTVTGANPSPTVTILLTPGQSAPTAATGFMPSILTASGTYTPPTGAGHLLIASVGGGGGGAGAGSAAVAQLQAGAGGGAAGTASVALVATGANTSLTVVIGPGGAGGAGGAAGGATGSNGTGGSPSYVQGTGILVEGYGGSSGGSSTTSSTTPGSGGVYGANTSRASSAFPISAGNGGYGGQPGGYPSSYAGGGGGGGGAATATNGGSGGAAGTNSAAGAAGTSGGSVSSTGGNGASAAANSGGGGGGGGGGAAGTGAGGTGGTGGSGFVVIIPLP